MIYIMQRTPGAIHQSKTNGENIGPNQRAHSDCVTWGLIKYMAYYQFNQFLYKIVVAHLHLEALSSHY